MSATGKSTTPRTIKPFKLLWKIPTSTSTIAATSTTMLPIRIPTPGTDVAGRSVSGRAASCWRAAPGAGVAVGFTSVAIRSTSTCEVGTVYYHTDIYFVKQGYRRVAGADLRSGRFQDRAESSGQPGRNARA